jgi:hypothetical protein
MAIANHATQEVRRIQLSLAVSLKDKYSGGVPQGKVDLFLDGNERPVLNPSGYYAFINLPEGSYNINALSENYLDEKIEVKIESDKYCLDDKCFFLDIPLEISLIPRPSYPFPPGETLVRGTLRDSKGPVSGAQLEVNLRAKFSTRTDEMGEFVIFFDSLKEEDVMKEGRTLYLKGSGIQGKSREVPVECRIDNKLMQIENQLSDVILGTTKSWNPVLTG